MRLLPMRKISRHSKRLALFFDFLCRLCRCLYLYCKREYLSRWANGECGIFISRNRSEKFGWCWNKDIDTVIFHVRRFFLLTIYKEKLRIVKKPIISLIPLAILSLIIGFIPLSVDNMFIVPPLAFLYGTGNNGFRRVSGIAYNNAFMTGNIKRTMLAFGEYVRTKHTAFLMEGLIFVSLLVSFILGVVIFSLLNDYLQRKNNFRCPYHDEYFFI